MRRWAETPETPALAGRSGMASPPMTGFSALGGMTPIEQSDRSGFLDGRDETLLGGLGRPSTLARTGAEYFGLREPGQHGGARNDLPLFAGEQGNRKRPRKTASLGVLEDGEGSWQERCLDAQRQLVIARRKLEDEQSDAARIQKQLERELRHERSKREQKEAELLQANRQEEDMRRQTRQLELASMREKHEQADKIAKLEKDLRRAGARGEEVEQTLKEQVAELKQELEYVRGQNDEKDAELQAAQAEMDGLRARAARAGDEAASREDAGELQLYADRLEREKTDLQMQVEALKRGVAVEGRARTLAEELKQAASRERALRERLEKAKNEIFASRERSEEVAVVREQMKRVEEQRAALVSVEAERDQLRSERSEWETLFKQLLGKRGASAPETVTPRQVLSLLGEMESECAGLSRKKGDLEVRLATLQAQLKKEREAGQQAATQAAAQEEKNAMLEEQLAEYKRRTVFLTKERDSLLRVVDLTKEEAFATLSKSQQGDAEVQAFKEKHTREASELRAQLAEARERVKELEAQTGKSLQEGMSPAAFHRKAAKIDSLNKRIEMLTAENTQQGKALDKALDRVAELEHQVASGMYNPTRTKILHLTHNPQRKALGDGGGSAASDAEERAAPAPGAADPNKRTERLKQMFKEKTRVFKDAVYRLTGYQIDMMDDKDGKPQLRLRSMFAENAEDELLFQWDADGKSFQLLETPFCADLDENTFAYLTKCNSIPAFLSTLTLDLFGKQTLAIS